MLPCNNSLAAIEISVQNPVSMSAPEFRTSFDPAYGSAVEIAPGIRRLTVENPGPFTFHGTNSYIVGSDVLAVIDPGPKNEAHLENLLAAIDGRPVSHIVVTHTHLDHSPLAEELAAATGAQTVGEGRHRTSRELHLGEINALDASGDHDFLPDVRVGHGDIVHGEGWSLEAVATPGHTANHMAFALGESNVVFSGDHVMAWSTSIVAPPDGSMKDYMQSLETMLARPETVYLPGHGGRLRKAREFVRALRAHRKMREAAILARIRKGDRSIAQIVETLYRDTDPRLHGAAALSVFAHIEDLVENGTVQCQGQPSLESDYLPV